MQDPLPQNLSSAAEEAPDADAVVRFGASSDRMKLCVVGYVPARGRGRTVDAELIAEAARRAGVAASLEPKALARVVDLLRAGKDARTVVIARGVRPGSPRDARLEPLADLSRPVFTGMAIGRLHPARFPAEGCDLAGNPVAPACPGPPETLGVPPDAGCVLGRDGVLSSTSFGLVEVCGGAVRVRPAVQVSPDRLTVTGTIHDRNALGERVVASHIKAELARLGVAGDARLIARALDEAWTRRQPSRDAVLARGLAPRHGRDAWLELLVQEREAVGTLDCRGCMDWRERGFHPAAEAGQEIARLHPPGEGVPGVDVFGRDLPARPGRDLAVEAGGNVEAAGDGTLFRALAPGVVRMWRGRLEVSELLLVPGDVDLSTGNIRLRSGSVRVRGSVRAGCAVEAPDCVLVDRVVEDARIEAGGDVNVAWGLCMDPAGETMVRAGGSVFASFAQNARIDAGEDVVVARYISRSDVKAGFNVRAEGWVRVTGARGRIMGGAVVGGAGIEAYEAGSSLGVPTVLALTREGEDARALVAEKRRLRAEERRIVESLAVLMRGTVASLTPEQREGIRTLSAQRTDILGRICEIGKRLAELAREYLARAADGRVVVRGVAHPGVVVKMGGQTLRLVQPVQSCQFLWDGQARRIRTAAL